MSNHDTDLTDLDPTDDDLALAETEVFDAAEASEVDDDLDFDSNYEDDRYSGTGKPSWSLFA
jgi:hypothetical protein